MAFIKRLPVLGALLLAAFGALAVDSTGGLSNPSVSIHTVTAGSACPGVGAIAQTSAGAYATCEGGVWTTRNISNPSYVQGVAYIGPFEAVAAFAQCPAGKKVLFSSCLIYAPNGSFFHDEHGPASGIDLATSFPISGDTGAYCYYVSAPGASGYVVSQGVCGDR